MSPTLLTGGYAVSRWRGTRTERYGPARDAITLGFSLCCLLELGNPSQGPFSLKKIDYNRGEKNLPYVIVIEGQKEIKYSLV